MAGPQTKEMERKYKQMDRLILAGRLDSPSFHAIARLAGGVPTIREGHLMVMFPSHGNATLSKTLNSGVRFRSNPNTEPAIDAVLLHEPTQTSTGSVTFISVSKTPEARTIMVKTKLTKDTPKVETDAADVTNRDEVPDEDKQILAAIESERVQAGRF